MDVNRLGVLGWPVAHSLSPAIQNAALQGTGLGEAWRYQLLPVPAEVLEETVQALPNAGFRGVNVTIPYKSEALALAQASGGVVSERARAIGAANTLIFRSEGRIDADNTDAPALVQALGQRIDIAGSTALVLGSGGSARAAVWALLDAGASDVRIWNRTPERAFALAAELGAHAVSDPRTASDVDVLVNCTPVGLRDGDQLGALSLDAGQLSRRRAVVDFVYGEDGTPVARVARSLGIPTIDGLELLVGQGAIAFTLFTGIPAPVDAMRRAVGLSSAP